VRIQEGMKKWPVAGAFSSLQSQGAIWPWMPIARANKPNPGGFVSVLPEAEFGQEQSVVAGESGRSTFDMRG
jgi:hypothetical protein